MSDEIKLSGTPVGTFLGVHTNSVTDKVTGKEIELHQASIRLGPALVGTLRLDAAGAAALHAAGPAIVGRRVEVRGAKTLFPATREEAGVRVPVVGQDGSSFYKISTAAGPLYSAAPPPPVTLRFLPQDASRPAPAAVAVEGI
jgi:hypothetical protein